MKYIYLYDHPSGDKEVGGGRGGKGVVRSIDRAIGRGGNGAAAERERIGNGSDYSFDYQFAYYPFMQSMTHSAIQSITHLIIVSIIYSITHSHVHSMIHSA